MNHEQRVPQEGNNILSQNIKDKLLLIFDALDSASGKTEESEQGLRDTAQEIFNADLDFVEKLISSLDKSDLQLIWDAVEESRREIPKEREEHEFLTKLRYKLLEEIKKRD